MALSPFVRPFGIACAILGIVEGATWVLLSLFAILIHTKAWNPKPGDTYGGYLTQTIVDNYLQGKPTGVYISPGVLFIWSILYLIGSLFWLAFSSYQLSEWCIFTFLLSICDFILTIMLGLDYDELVKRANKKQQANQQTIEDHMKILACGIVMTLAARGFVLWVLNVVSASILAKISAGIPKKIQDQDSLTSVLVTNAVSTAGGENTLAIYENPSTTYGNPSTTYGNISTVYGTYSGLPRLPPIQATNKHFETTTTARKISMRSSVVGGPFSTYSDSYSRSPLI